MDTAVAAKEIRTQLKAKGWNTRKISVRSDRYSMGSTIRVEIKDPSIPLTEVAAVAEPFARVHRCKVTGDILSGGNMHVDVEYSRDALEDLIMPLVEAMGDTGTKLGELAIFKNDRDQWCAFGGGIGLVCGTQHWLARQLVMKGVRA